jgi:hypothetical protein
MPDCWSFGDAALDDDCDFGQRAVFKGLPDASFMTRIVTDDGLDYANARIVFPVRTELLQNARTLR